MAPSARASDAFARPNAIGGPFRTCRARGSPLSSGQKVEWGRLFARERAAYTSDTSWPPPQRHRLRPTPTLLPLHSRQGSHLDPVLFPAPWAVCRKGLHRRLREPPPQGAPGNPRLAGKGPLRKPRGHQLLKYLLEVRPFHGYPARRRTAGSAAKG